MKAQGLVEYALILALVAILVIVFILVFVPSINQPSMTDADAMNMLRESEGDSVRFIELCMERFPRMGVRECVKYSP